MSEYDKCCKCDDILGYHDAWKKDGLKYCEHCAADICDAMTDEEYQSNARSADEEYRRYWGSLA